MGAEASAPVALDDDGDDGARVFQFVRASKLRALRGGGPGAADAGCARGGARRLAERVLPPHEQLSRARRAGSRTSA